MSAATAADLGGSSVAAAVDAAPAAPPQHHSLPAGLLENEPLDEPHFLDEVFGPNLGDEDDALWPHVVDARPPAAAAPPVCWPSPGGGAPACSLLLSQHNDAGGIMQPADNPHFPAIDCSLGRLEEAPRAEQQQQQATAEERPTAAAAAPHEADAITPGGSQQQQQQPFESSALDSSQQHQQVAAAAPDASAHEDEDAAALLQQQHAAVDRPDQSTSSSSSHSSGRDATSAELATQAATPAAADDEHLGAAAAASAASSTQGEAPQDTAGSQQGSDASDLPDIDETPDAAAAAAVAPGGEQQASSAPAADSEEAPPPDQAADSEGAQPPQQGGQQASGGAHDSPLALKQQQQQRQEQLSVDADEFASPCSSWHSCMTSASKASSASLAASTSRGLSFVAAPAAAAVAHTARAPAPAASSAAATSPVSSLHLALQQQRQEEEKELQEAEEAADAAAAAAADGAAAAAACSGGHAEAVAPEAAAAGPQGGDAVGLPPPEEQDPCATAVASRSQLVGSETAPIPVQQQQLQQHQQPPGQHTPDDVWQSVSPPSPPGLGCSPPLMLQQQDAAQAPADAAGSAADEGGAAGSAARPIAAAGAGEGAAVEPGMLAAGSSHEADYDDVGQGHFYSSSTPTGGQGQALLTGQLLHPDALQQQHMLHLAASSQMQLRQSELVDLSLSTSVHPAHLQQQQHWQQHAGALLAAHQLLPPAAAQAVERAAVALNDSFYYHGRPSPSELLGSAGGSGGPPRGGPHTAAAAAAAAAAGGLGLAGRGIRRAGAAQMWSRAQTQPQTDQQARHRLPSNAGASSAPSAAQAGPFGWPRAAVLSDWFSHTMQHPLAAASRAAAGVGQRLGVAAGAGGVSGGFAGPGPHHMQQQHGGSRPVMAGLAGSSAAIAAGARGLFAAPAGPAGAGADATGALPRVGSGLQDDGVMVEVTPDLPQTLQEQEDEAFRGLLFLGGRDSHGRPVVVVNTDAIPAGANPAPRDAALAYLLKRLGPLVSRGPYVLLIVALHHGPAFRLLPGLWCLRAYQALPRAFRKNVKHIIILQPGLLVKAALTLLWPFVSAKAHGKVKQVGRLLDIDAATSGEVQVPHLGEQFLTTLHQMHHAGGDGEGERGGDDARARCPDGGSGGMYE